ncbi:hypothetical protein SAMN05428945_4369 [Streptomyces sp. 2224.1]|uniref:hypothetical protein n=1 Tax=Streptomyces sp. 2114.4 TaxID=1938836 RepID=UPI00087EB326|nr:hypothetical protein [Streptomyces sp. 2114.4]PBC81110.1 hypothetical protein BX261_0969 [Streptomyces sp. 2321.6]SDR56342.1 hypothetical protein SAMN05216511_6249 [Streptomyces sp. KS_16]SEC01684.1 hypothetical protein SAMN05428940_0968 [Streptomyces sp. 2133.1]SED26375.1 hypothetical protein SAMN05428945_4369 [Streptomyces sp. 2224.1]SEF10335.1 hypothetical protein SAMN05428954_6307 [Streptomyces sp. 2112.3]
MLSNRLDSWHEAGLFDFCDERSVEMQQEKQAADKSYGKPQSAEDTGSGEWHGYVRRLKTSVRPEHVAVPLSRLLLNSVASAANQTAGIEQHGGSHRYVHHCKQDSHGKSL